MKSFILPLVLVSFITSCITANHVHYSDPNYLNSNEFSTYEEITANNEVEQELFNVDTTIETSTNYSVNDYLSSFLRRFFSFCLGLVL